MGEKSVLKKGPAIHRAVSYGMPGISGISEKFEDLREVRVMAVAEGYAMVRRKGAIPYVARVNEIEQD